MRIVTTNEFRKNQKAYFDLAENEKVIIHRGKNRKPFLLTPMEESEESDILFYNADFVAKINKAEEEISKGNCTRFKTAKELCNTMK
jgi:hypothetical protein